MKKDILTNCKTLLPHYASSRKSIDDNREDLISLRLLGSDPLVSVQIEMRSLQNLSTNKTTFWRVRYEVPSPEGRSYPRSEQAIRKISGLALFHVFDIALNQLLRIEL